PLILYDLDGDGRSEVILAAKNLVLRQQKSESDRLERTGPEGGFFPLTPALSPKERENRGPVLRHTRAPELFQRQRAGLPLPKGEGRGEGEGSARSPELRPSEGKFMGGGLLAFSAGPLCRVDPGLI